MQVGDRVVVVVRFISVNTRENLIQVFEVGARGSLVKKVGGSFLVEWDEEDEVDTWVSAENIAVLDAIELLVEGFRDGV